MLHLNRGWEMGKIVALYRTKDGDEPFVDWLLSLKDRVVKERIQARIRRIESGNYGDHKRFLGILEIRLDFGKGYRLYCGEKGNTLVVLLAGGDKSTQNKDIRRAIEYWEDYNEQEKN